MTYPLNLLDLALTLYALSIGCTELNPLMQSPAAMIFYKVIIVGGLCWVLHHFRESTKLAGLGLNLCTAVYGGLCIYHLYGLFMIGGM
jgi:hypothetical protein